MKTLSKMVAMACALFMLGIVFTSCSDDDDKKDTTTDVGVCLKSQSNDWRKALNYYAKKGLDNLGLTYSIVAAENGTGQATQLAKAALESKVIILSPEGVSKEAVQAVIEKGVPIILAEEEYDVNYTALVQVDNNDVGKEAAAYMAKTELSKVAVYGVTEDPASSNARVDNFIDTFEKTSPNTTVVLKTLEKYTRENGKEMTLQLLDSDPTVEGIFAQDDEIALGVLDALAERSNTTVKTIIGCGGAQGYFSEIKISETVDLATILYSPAEIIGKCVDIAADVLKGDYPTTKKIVLTPTTVNKDNVEKYIDSSSPY